jgi:hypothetical protein
LVSLLVAGTATVMIAILLIVSSSTIISGSKYSSNNGAPPKGNLLDEHDEREQQQGGDKGYDPGYGICWKDTTATKPGSEFCWLSQSQPICVPYPCSFRWELHPTLDFLHPSSLVCG